ncbi:hypothetical protein F5B20DRAFT_231253 [Whalleya microplaca]|nr:hypothetical protein F5B20DRAFT_231253 [Whalleya microplaca]
MGSNETLLAAQLEAILNSPALYPPPEGAIPDFDNPSNSNRLAMGVIATCMATTTLFALVRCYTRVCCVKRVRLEDYLALLAFGFYIAGSCVLITIPHGIGFFVYQWSIRLKDIEGFIYDYVLATILYCCALMLIKISILLEWAHLFVPRYARNLFYRICHGMIFANALLYIAIIVVINFACTPRERIWRRWVPGTCININAFNLFITSFNLIFDIIILALPHGVIWKLSLSIRQKLGVSVVFSVGLIACVCAAGRVASAFNLSSSLDTTFAYSGYLIWGIAEVTTAQLVFYVPALPIAFRGLGLVSILNTLLPPKKRKLGGPQNLLSQGNQRHSWPQTARRGVPIGEYSRMEENIGVSLTELEPVKTRSEHEQIQHEESAMYNHHGILRTTEIEITTVRESDPSVSHTQHDEHLHPWLDV